MPDRITTSTIEESARRLPAVIVRTPLLPARWLTEQLGTQVMLKCENLQLAGSFKIRGAYTKVSRLSPYERRRGIITYSSGNHAQAVAMAAKFFDTAATVVMPESAPQVKIDRTRELGARVIQEGTTSTERQEKAENLAAKEKLTMIPPFDDMDIIAGQGTVGRELVQDWPDVQAVLVPIGGGGLISGVATWIREAIPHAKIIGVEPEGVPSMKASLAAGEPKTLEPGGTIADGLAPVRPGDITFAHCAALVDDIVTVDDDALREATALLWAHSKLVVEFSGAAAVAALISGAYEPDGLRTAAVLTGGNIDPDVMGKLLEGDLARPATRAMAARAAAQEAGELDEESADEDASKKGSTKASSSRSTRESASKPGGSKKAANKSASKKKSTRKAASKKKSSKKAASNKKSSKKASSKKSASKKSASKKSASKKSASKKSASKKASSKKGSSAKGSSKKKASKKSGGRKAASKKSASKKKSSKKSASKKKSSKKSASKKSGPKKKSSKKGGSKKGSSGK